MENLDEFSEAGQDWILGTLTCLKNNLVPIVSLPGGVTCDEIANVAFDSHVFCYMDNGFCEQIFNFGNPLELAAFVADLLKVFEVPDFLQFVAIKQVRKEGSSEREGSASAREARAQGKVERKGRASEASARERCCWRPARVSVVGARAQE